MYLTYKSNFRIDPRLPSMVSSVSEPRLHTLLQIVAEVAISD